LLKRKRVVYVSPPILTCECGKPVKTIFTGAEGASLVRIAEGYCECGKHNIQYCSSKKYKEKG